MKTALLIIASALGAAMLVPAVAAPKPVLLNLTKVGNKIADGNAACPNTDYFLYSGGHEDNFLGASEPAYPSPGAMAYFANFPATPVVKEYDTPIDNALFADGFNLQNNRSVCYAIVQFHLKPTGDDPYNDTFGMVHFEPDGTYSKIFGANDNGVALPTQAYALDSVGRAALGAWTGTPDKATADIVMQDDTTIDFFKMYVWYGPN